MAARILKCGCRNPDVERVFSSLVSKKEEEDRCLRGEAAACPSRVLVQNDQ
jgi:hypothetical protein